MYLYTCIVVTLLAVILYRPGGVLKRNLSFDRVNKVTGYAYNKVIAIKIKVFRKLAGSRPRPQVRRASRS